jgi:hypothetical protein
LDGCGQGAFGYFLKLKNIWDISHPAFDIESIQPQYGWNNS